MAGLEMEWGSEESILNNDFQWCDEVSKDENGDAIFGEQLAAVLGEDFPYSTSFVSAESDTSSPNTHFDTPSISNYDIDKSIEINVVNNNKSIEINVVNNNRTDQTNRSRQIRSHISTDSTDSEDKKQEAGNDNMRSKRKRQPSQVQDHIMAERKRRELLTQRFIALSAIVPGLKKTDKTSVLGEAIKHMQQLQERVKALEEVAAKHTVESVVVVKKTKLVVDTHNNNHNHSDDLCIVGDNVSSSSIIDDHDDNNCTNTNEMLPQIEVKVSDKNVLFKMYCHKQRGILPKLFSQLEKHCFTVVNTSIIPFADLALDITILAQMEIGFNKNVKEVIRDLHSTLRLQAPST